MQTAATSLCCCSITHRQVIPPRKPLVRSATVFRSPIESISNFENLDQRLVQSAFLKFSSFNRGRRLDSAHRQLKMPNITRMSASGQFSEDGIMEDSRNGEQHVLNNSESSVPGKPTNIVWQECSVSKEERQKLLGQKGCVIWITGLSGSGKSTLACALSHALYCRGKLTYILDGDNVRHGLNKNLGFSAEERAENIRRVGEVAKLFVDVGVICIASLISPYRRDRDACRALFLDGEFIEIFMNFPLELCEERDSKGLYKLARAGKIKGFTGIDDPYEPPVSCEIMMQRINGVCPSPKDMAEKVVSYLEAKCFI
eukprot:Gb_10911 [translate_table: standard]